MLKAWVAKHLRLGANIFERRAGHCVTDNQHLADFLKSQNAIYMGAIKLENNFEILAIYLYIFFLKHIIVLYFVVSYKLAIVFSLTEAIILSLILMQSLNWTLKSSLSYLKEHLK